MIVPPQKHLDQRRLLYRLDVSAEDARVETHLDEFGNLVHHVHVPVVGQSIDFEAWIVAERRSGSGNLEPGVAGAALLHDRRLLDSSPRTEPDTSLRSAARTLLATGGDSLELAGRINTWVYEHMRYAHDVTDIHTTAAEALARGHGVCQDYAHIMIALCRLCGLSARYVSGHLMGEGGTHAWVEVVLPDASGELAVVHPFDPTHNRRPGMSYVTVAVGRDYGDVAPTSGTYRAPYAGRLSSRKRVDLTGIDYSSED